MNNRVALICLLWVAASCAQSQQTMPTAIIKTQGTVSARTPVAPAATLAPSAPTMTAIPSPAEGLEIGNLRYALPSNGRGWCLVNTDSFAHLEVQHLSSACQPNQDPNIYIDFYHFHTRYWSVSAILHFFVKDNEDSGFKNVKLQILDQVEQPFVGTATLATLDMTDNGKPVSVTLYAFLVKREPYKRDSYIIQGSGPATPEGTQVLEESLKSLLDSIVVSD